MSRILPIRSPKRKRYAAKRRHHLRRHWEDEKERKSKVGNALGGNLFYTDQTRRRPSLLSSAIRDVRAWYGNVRSCGVRAEPCSWWPSLCGELTVGRRSVKKASQELNSKPSSSADIDIVFQCTSSHELHWENLDWMWRIYGEQW